MNTNIDQQREALAYANRVRLGITSLKADIRAGRMLRSEAVRDERADPLMVGDFLQLAPRCGQVRVRRMLGDLASQTRGPHEVKLWPWSLMRDLTSRQRDVLAQFLEAEESGDPFQPPPPPKPRLKRSGYLSPDPLVAYLRSAFPEWAPSDLAGELGVPERSLWAVMNGAEEHVTLTWVDRAVTRGLGRPDLLNVLYPVEEGV